MSQAVGEGCLVVLTGPIPAFQQTNETREAQCAKVPVCKASPSTLTPLVVNLVSPKSLIVASRLPTHLNTNW